jgi:hypothetical protein
VNPAQAQLKLPDLTPRQREVIAMRANGMNLSEIAAWLGTSEQVVKNVCGRVRRRWRQGHDDRMPWDRVLALAIITGQVFWEPHLSKVVPLEEQL